MGIIEKIFDKNKDQYTLDDIKQEIGKFNIDL